MSNGYTSIEDYPYLQVGKVALAPGPKAYLYAPIEPGGLVPAVTPPPDTVEGYPPFLTSGVGIALDGGVWQYQGANGMTEVIPSLQPPTNVTPPLLTYVTGGGGAGNVGSIYQCSTGTWTPSTPTPVYTRQWLRDGAPISGSVGASYAIATADIGHIVSCAVVATNPAGSSAPVPASNPVGPIPDPGRSDQARFDDNGGAQEPASARPAVVKRGGGSTTRKKR